MKKQTVLVVDDNPLLLKLSSDIFEIAGYEVISAPDGEAALNILNNRKLDLVITDILMPGVDGYLLCYEIRINPELTNLPVIIYTATYTSASDEALAMEIGADKFIRKPAPMETLIEAAKAVLSGQRPIHKIPTKPVSAEARRQYNEGLVSKLENKNIQLEETMAKLALSEAQLKQAQSVAHIGSWEVDLVTGEETWSDELFNVFALTKNQVPPTVASFLTFIHPEDQAFVTQKIENAYQTMQDAAFEFRFIRKDTAIRFGFTKYKFKFGKDKLPVRLFGIVQDVTQRKVMEQTLKEVNERYEILSRATNDAVWDWDIVHDFELWNHGIETIFGYTERETYSSREWSKQKLHPDDFARVDKEIQDAFANKRPNWTSQYQYKCANGAYKHVLDRAYIIYADNKPVRMIGAMQDITEVHQYRQSLEKMVEERTSELNAALVKQKELNELTSKFVTIASHEFRTPLSSISFAAESVRNHFHQLTADDIRRKLIKIEELASHMTNLLEDILTIGKSDAGKIKVKRVSIDLKEFMDSLVEEISAPGKKEHAQVIFNFKCTRHTVNADDKLLRNIVINLLTNAIKFSPDNTPVMLTVFDRGRDVVIEVVDSGIGIDKEDLATIFEAFQRGSNASAIQGTGLGLSILKKSAEMMNGTVTVTSELGKGSTFTVSIPVQ